VKDDDDHLWSVIVPLLPMLVTVSNAMVTIWYYRFAVNVICKTRQHHFFISELEMPKVSSMRLDHI